MKPDDRVYAIVDVPKMQPIPSRFGFGVSPAGEVQVGWRTAVCEGRLVHKISDCIWRVKFDNPRVGEKNLHEKKIAISLTRAQGKLFVYNETGKGG